MDPDRGSSAASMWEGDKIFLDLLQTEEPFFSLKLVYKGETLCEAWLNERKIQG